MIPRLDPKEFAFTFESKGTRFIFEDLVVAHGYMKGESVTIGQSGETSVFVAKESVARMNTEGARRTASDFDNAAKLLNDRMSQISRLTASMGDAESLAKEEVERGFALIKSVMDEYSAFDTHFTDGTYAAAKESESARESLKSIERHKNEIRSGLNAVFFSDDSYLSMLLRMLSKQFSISEETLSWYTAQELLDLFDGKSPEGSILDDRKICFAYYVDRNLKWTLVAGKEAENIASIFSISAGTETTFKGITAYGTGTITGRVRIVRRDYANPEATKAVMAAMNEGEIMVTETTDPDLMEGFRKAAAVITDVGGMLSHAAITARELKKVCVIGTGSASKTLKDGDMVEVDADNGVVRIIEKAQR